MIKKFSKHVIGTLAVLVAALSGGWSTDAFAQNQTVSGTVIDETGLPVIGAGVVVVGQNTIGTTTDLDGVYSLSVPAGSSLEFSCIGYDNQIIEVGTQSVINVTMVSNNFIEETVVIGYGVQKKSDLTGSVASVRSEDLQNRSTTDAAAALQGKAAGVQIINTSGAPGSGAQIRVRGYSSNSGNLGPLLIVDGLKVDNIQYLDPSMIESMEVLKDAASAAIYGAEAGNGVVLITTKTGADQNGTSHVTYNFRLTSQMLGKRPELFGTHDYIDYQQYIGLLTPEALETVWDGQEHDWIEEVFAPSWSQQHSVTFSGGNNKGHFFASLNYVNNDGIVKGDRDTYNRLSAQINADYQLFKWLQVGTNTSFEKWATQSVSAASYGSALNSAMSLDPLTPPYYSNIEDCAPDMISQYYSNPDLIYRDPNHNNDFYATSKYLSEATGNPLFQRDRDQSSNGGITVRGTMFANMNLFEGFTFTSRFGYRISQSSRHSYSKPYYITAMASSPNYSISANVNTSYYYQWENFANYNRTFGKHSIGAMAGMSYIESNSDGASISSSGTDILQSYEEPFLYINYLLSDAQKSVGNAPSKSTQISYFGRLMYTYDDRYSIQANFRADAFDSSKLSREARWGYFPSFSAGWTISNENFVRDNVSRDVLSFLKLRASWGRNGNINVLNGYPYLATIALNGQWYQYNPSLDEGKLTYGSGPTALSNPDLKWETSDQIDVGLDARMFGDRLTIGMDWYKKNTNDLLVSIAPVPEIGVKSTTVNAGDVLNTGFEMELGWMDDIGDFSYSINANIATLHNEVLELHRSIDRIIGGGVSGMNNKMRTAFEVGYPIWYFRGFKYVGVEEATGAPLYELPDGTISSSPGENDVQYIGKAIPDFTYGITINLAYKGFDFSVFGTGTSGNDIACFLYSADRAQTNTLTHFYNNSWKPDNHNAMYPDMRQVATNWNFWSSSAVLFNGSYFKFKQIQLGYTLPESLTKKALISNLRFFVSLDDFFTISSYPGLDPETATTGTGSSQGFDVGSYPTTRKVVLGVNLTF